MGTGRGGRWLCGELRLRRRGTQRQGADGWPRRSRKLSWEWGGASLMDGIEMGSREILSDAYYILRPPISTKDHPKCHGRLFPISSWRSHGVLLFYSPGGVSSIVDRFKKGEVFQHTWTSHLRYNHTSWTSWSENPFQRKPLGPPCGGANSMEIDSVYSSRFRKVLVCSWLGVVDINAWRPSISARRRTAGRFR